jgi:hypothetical protein
VREATHLPDQGEDHGEGGLGGGHEGDMKHGRRVDDCVDGGERVVRWWEVLVSECLGVIGIDIRAMTDLGGCIC